MKTTQLNKTLFALTLGAVLSLPAAFAEGLSASQIAQERQNLHEDGSLPFVHAPVLFGAGADSEVVWTDERIAEFENLHAQGSLPFVHSPGTTETGKADRDEIWTDQFAAEFRNLRSDGSLL